MRSLRIILTAATAALPFAATAQTSAPSAGQQPTLSEKLNATDGVITPAPSRDTEMVQRPPNVGSTMPVIPPQAVTPPGEMPDAK